MRGLGLNLFGKPLLLKLMQQQVKPIERTKPGQVITEGEPCAAYIGPAGAGHYVKMVHNGIEYADMQIICEAYHILKSWLRFILLMKLPIFLNNGIDGLLDSYLMEIQC